MSQGLTPLRVEKGSNTDPKSTLGRGTTSSPKRLPEMASYRVKSSSALSRRTNATISSIAASTSESWTISTVECM